MARGENLICSCKLYLQNWFMKAVAQQRIWSKGYEKVCPILIKIATEKRDNFFTPFDPSNWACTRKTDSPLVELSLSLHPRPLNWDCTAKNMVQEPKTLLRLAHRLCAPQIFKKFTPRHMTFETLCCRFNWESCSSQRFPSVPSTKVSFALSTC